jgi:AraC-like DNA-binding protein
MIDFEFLTELAASVERGGCLVKSLPIVRLSVLRPIVTGIRDHGIDPGPVLSSSGLTEEAVFSDDASVHVMVVHQFLENAAAAVGDPTFAATIGLRIDTRGWPMLELALRKARTLGDFLSIYVSRANELASSVQSYLEIRDQYAVFGETRLFEPSILPAQNDGFMAALSYSILGRLLGWDLDPARITMSVCDPGALPDELAGVNRLTGDVMGFRIRFPSEWLALGIEESAMATPVAGIRVTGTPGFLDGFRRLLEQVVGSGRIAADDAARLAQMSRGQLARRLRQFDTSISAEIAQVSLAFARDQLRHTRRPIGEIASALGYLDAANFARAFRKQTGQTPSEYRRESVSRSQPGA